MAAPQLITAFRRHRASKARQWGVPLDHARLRPLNRRPERTAGAYVLYWMQAARRLAHNHALDHALARARALRRPLVVYEGLRLDYPWASARIHRFVLEGMRANAAAARARGIAYWPFVETPARPARGLLARLAARAALVVTDDFPAFVVPRQSAALAARVDVAVVAVDACGVVPLVLLGHAPSAAAHLRRRLHRAFAASWARRASARPDGGGAGLGSLEPGFELWDPATLDATLGALSFARAIAPVASTPGGTPAARERLRAFAARRLRGYAEGRSTPAPPERGHASGLSPYLHFGHLSVEEVVQAVLAKDAALHPAAAGRREGFFGPDADVNAFLDELLVWRDLGHVWMRARAEDVASLDRALPPWARETLRAHARDPRPRLYTREQLEAADTGDPLWNAAQHELRATGTIHNYLRMLWGKKVLEWSRTPDEAYATLVDLNNAYALDGRDPNSWSGILWCFGLFDRPWPERKVFGRVRAMTSESAARKFDLDPYLSYVGGLPPGLG
jgi:deoxyribodipyrimidine photo-lyase